jgi:transcriptional antiterminator RfaH
MLWFVVQTKPKNEERASGNLANGGFEVLAPKLRTRKYREGRFVYVIEPMFPGYIFARFDPIDDFHMIKYTRGVKGVVHFGDRIAPVRPELVEFVRSRLDEGVASVERKPLSKGARVFIQDGPFKGLSGIFEKELDGRERVAILLEGIAFSATMEIDRDLVSSVE